MPTRPAKQPLILVIEDYGDSREMLKLLVAAEGYQVLTAATGEEALELVKHKSVDFILTDFGLPGMDGMAFARRIRKLDGRMRSVPIIMLTALDGNEYNEAALRAGCTDFLTKPVDFERLSSMIERLLKERQDRQDRQDRLVRAL